MVRTTDGIGTGALLLGTAGLGVGIGLLVAGPDADLYTRQPTERIGLRPYLDLDLTSRGGGLGVRGRF